MKKRPSKQRPNRKRIPEPDLGDDDEVGYGRPPVHSQFKPGQSGNPKGRPKGKPTRAQLVLAALNRKIPVSENGKRKLMTVEAVGLRKIADKAASGDTKAMDFLQSRSHEDVEARLPDQLSEDDERILDAALMRRLADADADEDWGDE